MPKKNNLSLLRKFLFTLYPVHRELMPTLTRRGFICLLYILIFIRCLFKKIRLVALCKLRAVDFSSVAAYIQDKSCMEVWGMLRGI